MFRTVGFLLAALCALTSALAADYPSRPVRMLIPFAPGGATDIIARMIEPKMSRALGQQIVVEIARARPAISRSS